MTPAPGGAAAGRALGPGAAAVRPAACLGAPPVGTSGKAPARAVWAGASRRPARWPSAGG